MLQYIIFVHLIEHIVDFWGVPLSQFDVSLLRSMDPGIVGPVQIFQNILQWDGDICILFGRDTEISGVPDGLCVQMAMDIVPISAVQLGGMDRDMCQDALSHGEGPIYLGDMAHVSFHVPVVMVPQHQFQCAIQFAQSVDIVRIAHCHISEDPDGVALVDMGIPCVDDVPVLFLGIFEAAMDGQFVMTEMQVGRHVYCIHSIYVLCIFYSEWSSFFSLLNSISCWIIAHRMNGDINTITINITTCSIFVNIQPNIIVGIR